jgi:hypothetical protein
MVLIVMGLLAARAAAPRATSPYGLGVSGGRGITPQSRHHDHTHFVGQTQRMERLAACTLQRQMLISLGRSGCLALQQAGVLAWPGVPAHQRDMMPGCSTRDGALAHARECGEAMVAIILQDSDRPLVRRDTHQFYSRPL